MDVIRGPEVDGRAPTLTIEPPAGDSRADGIVLVLHGGRARSTAPTKATQLAALRMAPFGAAARRRAETVGQRLVVARLRYRVRGWNGRRRDPVVDARWALTDLRQRYPDVPIVLLGHSMGGRTAIALAGEPGVVGLVLLAPWIEGGDPVPRLTGRHVLVVHGTADRMTDPTASRTFTHAAERGGAAGVRYVGIDGGKHAMLDHARTWHRLAADGVAEFVTAAGASQPLGPDGPGQDERQVTTAGRST